MLAIDSPEFSYENNMLFESPSGQMVVAKTYSNGQKHLWEVNEVTGKQTHTSHEAMLMQQAQVLVEQHTHYSLGSPETSTYGQMDWDGALNEIFGPAKTETESETESVQQDEFVLTPYMLEMQASSNPASIDHVIAGYASQVATPKSGTDNLVISGLPERITQTQTSAVEQKKPVDDAPNVAHSALTADPTIPLALGMVVFGRIGKTKAGDWLADKGASFAKWQREQRASYKGTTQAERRKFRNMRVAGVALMGVGAVLFLAIGNSCDEAEDTVSSPSETSTSSSKPTPSASASPRPSTRPSPGTEKPGPKDPNSADKPDPEKEKPTPISAELKPGVYVWTVAHDLLESKGYNHDDPNTDAIKDAMLKRMNITEAQAHFLAVNTKVPLFDDDEIEDILDNFSNTKPHKIKK